MYTHNSVITESERRTRVRSQVLFSNGDVDDEAMGFASRPTGVYSARRTKRVRSGTTGPANGNAHRARPSRVTAIRSG